MRQYPRARSKRDCSKDMPLGHYELLTAAGDTPLALVAAGAEPEEISEELLATGLDMTNAYISLLTDGPDFLDRY